MPRLVLLGIMLLAIGLGLDPLLRWALVRGGQSATGAKIEIGRLDTMPLTAEVVLYDLRVADPHKPMKNLFQVDRAALDFDAAALLRRNYVVDAASIEGIRLGTLRETSGALTETDQDDGRFPRFRLPQLDEVWLKRGADALWQQVERQSESIRLVRHLMDRWPAELERLQTRSLALADRVGTIEQSLQDGGNVLRRLERLQQAAGDLQEIARETRQIGEQLQRIGRQAAADREALARAQARDRQRLEELIHPDALKPDMLSEYLLGPEVADKVTTAVRWVRWMRELRSPSGPAAEPVRRRGIDFAFVDPRGRPDFLLRGATLSGEGELFGQALSFRGRAWDVTSHPQRHGRPTLVELQTTGGVEMRVQAGIDLTGPAARQRLVVDCPRMRHDRLLLGNPEQLSVAVAPGNARLGVIVDVEDDQLSGRITIDRRATLVEARLGGEYANPRLARRLQTALADVERLSAAVELSGTLKSPGWRIQSDLGRQLAGGIHRALAEELAVRRAELAGQLEARVAERMAAYERLMAAKHREVTARLQLGDDQVRQVRELVARKIAPAGPSFGQRAIQGLLK